MLDTTKIGASIIIIILHFFLIFWFYKDGKKRKLSNKNLIINNVFIFSTLISFLTSMGSIWLVRWMPATEHAYYVTDFKIINKIYSLNLYIVILILYINILLKFLNKNKILNLLIYTNCALATISFVTKQWILLYDYSRQQNLLFYQISTISTIICIILSTIVFIIYKIKYTEQKILINHGEMGKFSWFFHFLLMFIFIPIFLRIIGEVFLRSW